MSTPVEAATPTVPASTGSVDTTGAKIDAGPGETVFFDELDDVLIKQKREARAKTKEEKNAGKSEEQPKDEPKKPEEKKESAGEPKKGEPLAGKKGTEEDPKTEPKTEPKIEAKTRKYKIGDAEAEIPEDATFKVKVNGQEVDVPFNEILQNYSGKVAWDKKFSEVDRKSKEFERKLGMANQKIENIFKEEDPEMRFVRMAELTGKDPVQFRQKFLDENMVLLEKWYGMSEDERKADALSFENRILKIQREAQQKATQEQASLQDLDQRVGKLLESHKIPRETFLKRYDEIKELVAQGSFEAEKLNPEFITETIAKDTLWNSATAALKPLGITIESERIKKLVDLSYSQGLGQAEIAEMAKELWVTDPAKKAIAEKTADREEVLRGKQPDPEKTQTQNRGEPMFFSEIM